MSAPMVTKAWSWRKFGRNDAGAAAVEFTLILPVMLLLYIGTFEASSLISTDRRVQTITATVGDLVARTDGELTSDQLRDYFLAAENIIAPRPVAKLVQIVSVVAVDEDGETEILWSRSFNGGAQDHVGGWSAGDPYPLPSEITAISRDSFVVASETHYDFTPLLGTVFGTDFPLYRENFYLPRFGEDITLVGASAGGGTLEGSPGNGR